MANVARRNAGGSTPARSAFSDFFSDVDRFFENDLWRTPAQWGRQLMSDMPATNIREDDKGYSIELAAPGKQKDDFNIDVNEGMLTISSQKEENKTEENDNYTRREYNYSSFSRSFRLPKGVKEDDIKANYKDGILHIHVPKGEEEKPNRRISIE
ncbi:Hsp20/alpha crystallin family protein [Pontibacter oryzae]|uniref:Hsp20/alpha crystallin family protein n=1 Tax=Pontibacter oryzae TaxID=2304593 RepID=A0A399S0L1_9BACT|nr:Hsp20/alpha crystallin family protein [Pontibacter oryzae]RIJ37536.1 Hsp20/alpha crystallin family protein [Pontibacter oryzae]